MTQNLTEEKFKNQIFDFDNVKEGEELTWKFEGDKPAVIDFYADWCGPCKMVAPILEELSEEYEGKVDIYKVNTESEIGLSSMFGIRSIPSMLFIPMEGQPIMQAGALGKSQLKEIIEDKLV